MNIRQQMNKFLLNFLSKDFGSLNQAARKKINAQKIFKFTKNPDHLEVKTIMDRLTHLRDKESQLSQRMKLATTKTAGTNQIQFSDQQRRSINSQLYDIRSEIERIESHMGFIAEPKLPDQVLEMKEKVLRINLIKDVFSHNYSFQNNFLTNDKYKFFEEDIGWEDRKMVEDYEIVENTEPLIEEEITPLLKESMKENELDINKMIVRPVLSTKKIVNSVASNIYHPNLVQHESDLHTEYDLAMEHERLFKLLDKNDDFGSELKKKEQSGKKKGEDEEDEEEIDDSESQKKSTDQTLPLIDDPSIYKVIK